MSLSHWGIHSILPGQTMPVVRELAARGRPLAGVFSVDHPTLAAEIKAASPSTIVVTRITGDQDGDFNLSARIERGDAVGVIARELFERAMARTVRAELQVADYLCLMNEPDPPGAKNYFRLARCSMALADIVHAELGMKLAHIGLNNGTGEWDECVAMANAGLISYIRAHGDALVVHEGAYPPDSLVPLSAGYNGTPIPGAPRTPGTGPLSFRHRYLFQAAGMTCKVITGEWYAGYGVDNAGHVIAQARWYDSQCGDDVLFFAPFTGGAQGWESQDYEPLYPAFVAAALEPSPPAPLVRALGLDVSAWQDDNNTPRMMDWAKAKAAGASFAFIRASAGKLRDGDWEYNVIGATQAGLLVGAYHYLTFADNALEQARLFWSQVKTNGLALPLVADIEQEPFPTWGAAHVRAFIEEIEKLSGKKVVIYTRAGYWNYTLFGQGLESGRKLWVANYKTEKPLIPRGWTEWEFWQYTSEGDGPTYGAESVYIDQNYFNGTVEELRARYPVAAPPPSPIPQPSRVVWQDGFENGIDSWILFHVRSNSEGKHPTVNVERRSTGAHPGAVHGGDGSARVIGKWICWRSGLRRTVPLTGLAPGQICRALVWVRLWASERDDFPAEPNPEIVARAMLRVILPDGNVVEQTVSGFGWRELRVEWKASAANEAVVINLDADLGGEENHWPVLNTVAFWDDVMIESISPPVPPPPPPADYFPAWTHRVIIEELPVRVVPWRTGNAPRVVFTLGKGSRVEILQRDGDWGRLGLSQWIRLREGANTEARKA